MFKPLLLQYFFLTVTFTALGLLSACENDINKIREISARQVSKQVQRTKGVDVIYSDSAKVKARVLAPLMLEYPVGIKPYTVFPKGVKLYIFNDSLKISTTLVADSAIRRENDKLTEMYKNVVVTNAKGETLKSDELIWDENKKLIYSNKAVRTKSANGNVMQGTSFTSDETFTHWKMQQSTGVIHVNDNVAP